MNKYVLFSGLIQNYKSSHLVTYRLKKTPFFPDFEHFSARIRKFARKVRENCEKFQAAKAKNESKKFSRSDHRNASVNS